MATRLRKCALVTAPLLGAMLWIGIVESPRVRAETILKSGYELTDLQCGQAPDAYPKLRIECAMACAGRK